MKTKILRSAVMERAWNIYRSGSAYAYSFSNSLRNAWEIEKSYAELNRNSHTEMMTAYGDSHWADIVEGSRNAKNSAGRCGRF